MQFGSLATNFSPHLHGKSISFSVKNDIYFIFNVSEYMIDQTWNHFVYPYARILFMVISYRMTYVKFVALNAVATKL